jgi:hypothetical protein
MVVKQKHWLKPKEASPVTGLKVKTIYEQIRRGIFPFEYRRAGTSILISARDLGLITESANKETREGESLTASTPSRA